MCFHIARSFVTAWRPDLTSRWWEAHSYSTLKKHWSILIWHRLMHKRAVAESFYVYWQTLVRHTPIHTADLVAAEHPLLVPIKRLPKARHNRWVSKIHKRVP